MNSFFLREERRVSKRKSGIAQGMEREKKKEQSTILLPDDYTKVEGKYCSAVVHGTADDCRFDNLSVGSRILVDRAMIEEVEHDGEKHHLILDNYVIAQITE